MTRPALVPRPAQTRWVCLTGGDASGKSTQAECLVKALRAAGISAAEVSIWDGLADTDTGGRLGFGSKTQVDDYLRALGSRSRTHFLFHALHVAIDLAERSAPEVAVLNAHWYKYFASEVAHGGDRATLRRLTSGFTEPELTFYLDVAPEVALSRKSVRSGYESGFGTADGFLRIQRTAREVLDELADELHWVRLDGTEECEVLSEAISAEVVRRVRA